MAACVLTGGTGNVGHALAVALLAMGHRVYIIANPASKRLCWLPESPDCRILALGLERLAEAANFIGEKCGWFFHLGWQASYGPRREDARIQLCNVHFTLQAVDLVAKLGCEVFLGMGSQAQYGETNATLTENTPMRPTTFYGRAKFCAEWLSRDYCRKLGLRHVWARILSVYGPCDGPYTLVSYLMRCWLRLEAAEVTPGAQLWDFLYAEDAAAALIALAGRGQGAYCLASGAPRLLSSYLEDWRAIGGERAVLRANRPYPAGARRRLCADISRLREHTGFRPLFNFKEGLRKTLDWYIGHPAAV